MEQIYSRAWSIYVYLGEHSTERLAQPPFFNGRERKVLEALDSGTFSAEIEPEDRENLWLDIVDRP